MTDLRQAWLHTLERRQRKSERDPRWWDRLDALSAGILIAAVAALGVVGWVAGLLIAAQGWLVERPLQPVPDERILSNVRDASLASPTVDIALDGGAREVFLVRANGQLHRLNVETGLWRDFLDPLSEMIGRIYAVQFGCGSEEPIAGCPLADTLWAVTDRHGLARFDGAAWHVVISDTRFVGIDGKTVQQDALKRVAVSDDGRWILLDAGGGGFGLFDAVDGRWIPISAATQSRMLGGADPPSAHLIFADGRFWIGDSLGLAALDPATGTVEPIEAARGPVRDLEADPNGGLLVLSERACDNGRPDCLQILRLHDGQVTELIGEEERYPQLSGLSLFYASEDGRRVLAAGERGLYRYDPDQRSWLRVVDGNVDALWEPGRRGGLYLALADRVLEFSGGEAVREWSLERGRVAAFVPRRSARPSVVLEDGRVFALGRSSNMDAALEPGRSPIPLDAMVSGASLDDRIYLIGPRGVLGHDVSTRTYETSDRNSTAPILLQSDSTLQEAGGRLWAASDRFGRVAMLEAGSSGAQPLAIAGEALMPSGVQHLHPDGAGLLAAVKDRAPRRIGVGQPQLPISTLWPDPPGLSDSLTRWLRAEIALDGRIWFSDEREVQYYDPVRRTWSGQWRPKLNGSWINDIALVGSYPVVLSQDGLLIDHRGTPFLGAGPSMPFASADLTDALADGGRIFLGGERQVVAYDPSARRLVGAWQAGGPGPRIVTSKDGIPVIHAGDRASFGATSLAIDGASIEDVVDDGPGTVVSLQLSRGQHFLVRHRLGQPASRSCLFRRSRPYGDNLVDARVLGDGRIAVATQGGLSFYDPAARTWQPGDAMEGGRDARLHLLGAYLVHSSPGRLAIWPQAALSRPSSCATDPVLAQDNRLRQAVWSPRGHAVEEIRSAIAILEFDGAVNRWSGGSISPVLPPTTQGPDLNSASRVYQAGSRLLFAVAGDIWTYDLTHRTWRRTQVSAEDGDAQVVDLRIVGDSWVVTGRDRAGRSIAGGGQIGADHVVLRDTLSPLPFPDLPADPSTLIDVAALPTGAWAFLFADRVAVLDPVSANWDSVARFETARDDRRLHVVADRLLVTEPKPSGSDRFYLFPERPSGDGGAAGITAEMAPEPGDRLFLDERNNRVWRLDARNKLFECESGRGSNFGSCVQVLRAPVALDPDAIEIAAAIDALHLVNVAGRWRLIDRARRTSRPVTGPAADAPASGDVHELDGDFLINAPDGRLYRIGTEDADSRLIARTVDQLLRLDQHLLLRMGNHVRVAGSHDVRSISEQLGLDISADDVVALTIDGSGESAALLDNGLLVRRRSSIAPVVDDILSLPGAPDLAGVTSVLAVDERIQNEDGRRWLISGPSGLILVSRATCQPDRAPAETHRGASDMETEASSGTAGSPKTGDPAADGPAVGDVSTAASQEDGATASAKVADEHQSANSEALQAAAHGAVDSDNGDPAGAAVDGADKEGGSEATEAEPEPVPCVETRHLDPPDDAGDTRPYQVLAEGGELVVAFLDQALRYSLEGQDPISGRSDLWPRWQRVRAMQPLDDTVSQLREGVRVVDALGPRLDPVTVSSNDGASVSLTTNYAGHGERVGFPLDTAGRARPLDADWLSWDRGQRQFQIAGLGRATTRLSPALLFPGRRFAGRAAGIATMLVDGGMAIANGHGVWRYDQASPSQLDAASVAFRPVKSAAWIGLAHGAFLAADERSFDPQAGIFRNDDDRYTVASGPLRITEALRAGTVYIELRRAGDSIDPRGDHGFLWDRRLDVGLHDGEVRLLTPAGLVYADRLEGALPLPAGPAGDARLWTGDGLHFRSPAKDWFALTPTGWRSVSDPTLDWKMADTPRRSWFSEGGEAKIEPAPGADPIWARRDGMKFLADDVRALGGGRSGLVLVTEPGTVAAPSFADLAQTAAPTDSAPARGDLYTLRLRPDRIVTTAGRGDGVELWDVQAQRWRPAGHDENPWVDRVAADTRWLRVRLRNGLPVVETSVRTLAGGLSDAKVSWRTGQHLPFDDVRSIYGDGGTLYVGTRAGLELRTGAPADSGELIDTRRSGTGEPEPVIRIGRPARDRNRLVAELPGASCLELGSASPSRCAVSADLDRRFVGETRFWSWTEGNGVQGRYRDASGHSVGPRMTGPRRAGNRTGFPHDTPSDAMRCKDQSFSLWGDGMVTVSPAGGFTIGQGTRTFALSSRLERFLCQPAATTVDDVMVSDGAYVIGGGLAFRFDGAGWTAESSAIANAAMRLTAGDLPWFNARMRLTRPVGHGFVLQYRAPSGMWMDLPWRDDRWAIDDVGLAVRAHGRTWLVTAGGLVRTQDRGDRLVLDPTDVRIVAYPDGKSCQSDRAETLDGNTANVETAPKEPTRLRCADGRILQGVLDAGAAWNVVQEIDDPDPFVTRTLVETDAWRWSVTDRTVGEPGRIEVELRGELLNLTSGRFDADDLLSIGSVEGTTLDLATGRGWYRAPAQSPGLLLSRRPKVRPEERVTTIDVDRAESGERFLCLGSGRAWRVRYDTANGTLEPRSCGEFAGQSGLWQVRELANVVRMTGRSAAGLQALRRLQDGQFDDLKVIGLPIAGRSSDGRRSDLLVPTELGVSGLTFGQGVTDIHLLSKVDGGRAVFDGPDGRRIVADRLGLRGLEGAPVSRCPALHELLHRLPDGVRLIRVQEGMDTRYRVTVELDDGRAEYSGGCAPENGFRANNRKLSVVASEYLRAHQRQWEAHGIDEVALAWQPPVARAAAGDRPSGDLPEIAGPFQRSLVTRDRVLLLTGGELYGASADGLLKWVFEGRGALAQSAETPIGDPTLERSEPPEPLAEMTIRQMQTALQRLQFYDGAIDGIVGPKTRSAIRAFQRRNGFAVTGELTREQRVHLRNRAQSKAVR